ncbi:MAG: hypothetical protein AAB356_02640, partial [Deltaproteobacteria bacterium]
RILKKNYRFFLPSRILSASGRQSRCKAAHFSNRKFFGFEIFSQKFFEAEFCFCEEKFLIF